jgi:hypothetical protein
MPNENDLPMMAEVPVERLGEPEMEQPKEWRPSNAEALREYEIRIKFLNRGCIVSVGCKDIAFEDYTNAMAAINAYVANPWEEQQKWRKILD